MTRIPDWRSSPQATAIHKVYATCGFAGLTHRQVEVVLDALDVGGFLAPSAPSEPVQDGPRVWAMPRDVRKLRDRHGVVWQWGGGPYFTSGEDQGDELTVETLMTERGPLTEVVNTDGQ